MSRIDIRAELNAMVLVLFVALFVGTAARSCEAELEDEHAEPAFIGRTR